MALRQNFWKMTINSLMVYWIAIGSERYFQNFFRYQVKNWSANCFDPDSVIISSHSVTVTHYQSLSWHEENAVQLSMNSVHEEHIWPSNNLQKMQVGKSAITFCCNTFNGTLSQLFLSWEMSSFHLGISVCWCLLFEQYF